MNAEGSTTSKTVQFVLAETPSQPTSPPSEVASETTDAMIVVTATALTTENGGSSITGYEFQVDDGSYGDYTTIQGGSDSRTLSLKASITYGIIKGKTYRVRYRGINSVGEGVWSDPVEVTASTVPGQPATPIVTSADNTVISLTFTAVTDNGGEDPISYELYYADSAVSLSTFTQDSNYDGTSLTYDFSVPLTTGNTYGFKIRAINSRGSSEFSEVVYAAAGRAPDTPAAPTFSLSGSNRTHVLITWAEGTSQDIPVLGYRLSADDRGNGEYEVIYNGSGKPNVLSYVHGPLETGETYNYVLEVLNYNGASATSPSTAVTVCEAPSGFKSLEKVSATSTQIKIAWQPPQDNGG